MLHYGMLCYGMLGYIMLWYVTLWYFMLYCSGVFGILLSLSFIHLQDSADSVRVDTDMVEAVSKVTV